MGFSLQSHPCTGGGSGALNMIRGSQRLGSYVVHGLVFGTCFRNFLESARKFSMVRGLGLKTKEETLMYQDSISRPRASGPRILKKCLAPYQYHGRILKLDPL